MKDKLDTPYKVAYTILRPYDVKMAVVDEATDKITALLKVEVAKAELRGAVKELVILDYNGVNSLRKLVKDHLKKRRTQLAALQKKREADTESNKEGVEVNE